MKIFLNIIWLMLAVHFFDPIIAQDLSSNFSEAMENYEKGQYAEALKNFSFINSSSFVDENIASSSRFYSGECLYNMNELDGAVSEFEYFEKNYESSAFMDIALYRLGTIYFNQGVYNKARRRLLELIDHYPRSEYSGSSYYLVGQSYLEENDFNSAERFLLEAKDAKNNNYADYSIYSLADLYERTGDYKSAVKYYDDILGYYNESDLAPYAQIRIGVCYYNLKQYDNAVLELSDPAIQSLPENIVLQSDYMLANSFFRLKEYNNAAETYKRILGKTSDLYTARQVKYGLGQVTFQMHNYNDAFTIFDELANSRKDTIAAKSLFWSAECMRYSGDQSKAMTIYEDFLAKYPDHKLSSRAKFTIGSLYYQSNSIQNSERFLTLSINSEDIQTRAKALTLLGEINLDKHDYTTAQMYFSDCLDLDGIAPDISGRAELGLGISLYYQKKYEDAVDLFNELIRKPGNANNSKMNFYLAESYFILGQYNSALNCYNRTNLSDEVIGKEALYGKAYSYFNLKDYSNAAYLFKEFIEKYKRDKLYADAKLRLADSYYASKDFTRAGDIYREIFEKDRSSVNNDFAYYRYGQALFSSGRNSQAITVFTDLQLKFPRSGYADEAQYLIGWIYFQKGDFPNAVREYKRTLEKYSGPQITPVAYYSIGDCFYNLGNYDSAIVYYEKILSRFGSTKYIYDAVNGIQYCYLAMDQQEKAIEYINRYVINNPDAEYADQIYFKKGEIFYSTGDYESAIISYSDFIQKYPRSTLVQNAYYWIGKSAFNMNKLDIALENFSRAKNMSIKSEVGISSVIEMGRLYFEQKKYDDAINVYDEALKAISDREGIPELLYQKALAQIEKTDLTGAYGTFNEIIMYYDGSIFAAKSKIEIGLLELARGGYENAESMFKELGEETRNNFKNKFYLKNSVKNEKTISAPKLSIILD